MTTFIDGPAKGQKLLLRHAPAVLTVVVNSRNKWDALDQPDDEVRPDELTFTYDRVGEAGMVHVNFGRRRGGFYALAQYKWRPDVQSPNAQGSGTPEVTP